VISALGGNGRILVHDEIAEGEEIVGEHPLGEGLSKVYEASEEEILDAFGEMNEDSEIHASWRPAS